jgi:hypothetical protein
MGLKEVFEHQQRILELELELARERFAHMGLRGGAIEGALRDFLERHLLRALSMGTGEVLSIDGDGASRNSRQLDIVISNEFQPFQSQRDSPSIFLLEGVYAVGEVKATLARADMSTELEKAGVFRSLVAKNTSRLVAVPKPDTWESYYVFYRPYFLFAFGSPPNWKWILLEAIGHILENKKIPLDGIFLMDKQVAILFSPHVKFPFSKMAGIPFFHEVRSLGNVMGGIHVYETTAFLALFMLWLSLFRVSFFADQNPLAFYVEQIVNESLSDFTLAQNKFDGSVADYMKQSAERLAANPLRFFCDYLKADLEGMHR